MPIGTSWGIRIPPIIALERLFADGLDATVTVWSPDLNNYEYYTRDDKEAYSGTAYGLLRTKEDFQLGVQSRRAVWLPCRGKR